MQNQTRPIDELDARRAVIVEDIAAMQTRLREASGTSPADIAKIRKEADRLAAIFKSMIEQSNDAYASGQKELAHEIAVRRKRIHDECKALNAQANALRDEPTTLPKAIAEAEQELADLDGQLAQLEPIRHIAITDFGERYGVNARLVSEELAKLPPRVTRYIREVTYVLQLQGDRTVGRTAKKTENPEQTVITLYPTLGSLITEELEVLYRETVTHEGGHVLFDWIMTPGQRFTWGEFYLKARREGRISAFITERAADSRGEDFGECFMMYVHKPQWLLWKDEQRYNFIDNIYKEIGQ